MVDERDGSEESEYPIRTLQTRRVLKLAVPMKDPNSGKINTAVLEIHGPIAYMESTTDQRINPENANRCFEFYLDESEKQTRAIFAAQRRAGPWRAGGTSGARQRPAHPSQRAAAFASRENHHPLRGSYRVPAGWLRGRRDHDRF